MKRQLVLGVLVGLGAASIGLTALQQPAGGGQAAPKVVEVDKLKDNLYMLRGNGGGGNTAVFVMTDGVTVVDTKNPGWGQPILDKIKTLTDKPIVRIINTHTHGDHVSGNVEFPATVEVVTQENTAKNMQEMRGATGVAPPAGGAVNIFKQNNGKGLPKKTFKDKMKIGSGADEVDLYYFGRGHTNGDAWVVFPALRVMHAGDIFSGKNIPLLDANNGGSGLAIGDTLAKAAKSVKGVDQIITGHSTVMTVADLQEYSQFNTDFKNTVQAGKKAGMTVDQVAAAYKIPEKYKGYAAPAEARLKANVQIVFDETK
jgi:glyoxylase-like metal-dependent hydrolase (beta-lactamase superfamily II)